MRNRAFLKVVLLGLLTLAFAPGYAAAAGQGQDLTEMLASNAAVQATAVSPTLSVSAFTLDFGPVNNGTPSPAQTLTLSNNGDQTLNVTSITSNDPAFHSDVVAVSIGARLSAAVHITFSPLLNDVSSHSGLLRILSNSISGPVNVTLLGQSNIAPILGTVGNKNASAFATTSFPLQGTDDLDTVDDALTYTMSGLPLVGPTLHRDTGAFSWSPTSLDEGIHYVTYCVSDGRLSDCETSTINVTVTNHPPIANAGGSYFGVVGREVKFKGGGSTDQDGDELKYEWAFGDGHTAHEVDPNHIYQIQGSFIASLEVCDGGSPKLCSSDVAAVTIKTEVVADIIIGGKIHATNQDGTQSIAIQEVLVPYTSINLATLKVTTDYPNAGTVSECLAQTKGVKYGDKNADGVTDFAVNYLRRCLYNLFYYVDRSQAVNLIVQGEFTTPTGSIPLRGVVKLKLKKADPGQVAAFASPNPFNPETSISYSVRTGGAVTMRVYSVNGRLVRTLKDNEYNQPGSYEVRWDGVDNQGGRVPSGIYFIKTNSADETSVIKAVMAK